MTKARFSQDAKAQFLAKPRSVKECGFLFGHVLPNRN